MTWLRLDDQFHRHRKVAPLSDAAFRLHVTALLECSNQLTDGRLDCVMVPILPRAPTGKALRNVTDELVRAGLWHLDGETWILHDFLDWNPSADEVRIKRETRANAGRIGGQQSGKSRSKPEAIASPLLKQTPSKTEPKTNPVPVPVPIPLGSKADGGIPRPPGLGEAPPPSEVRQQRHSEVRSSKPEPKLEVGSDWRPRNRQEALNAPIAQRATWAMREQWAAAEYQPQAWPEVVLVAEAFHSAYKLAAPKLGRLDSDKLGTQRIVSLLTQYTPEQLVAVCKALPTEKVSLDRIGKGERPRLGWLSDEVVRTSFAGLPSERPVSERVKRMTAHLKPMQEVG